MFSISEILELFEEMEKDSNKFLPINPSWPQTDQATIAMMVMMAQPDRTLRLTPAFADALLLNQSLLPGFQPLILDPNLLPMKPRNSIVNDPLISASVKLHYLQQMEYQNMLRDRQIPKFIHAPIPITPSITSKLYDEKTVKNLRVQSENEIKNNRAIGINIQQSNSVELEKETQIKQNDLITLNPKDLDFDLDDDLSSIDSESELIQSEKPELQELVDLKQKKPRRKPRKATSYSTKRRKNRKRVKKY